MLAHVAHFQERLRGQPTSLACTSTSASDSIALRIPSLKRLKQTTREDHAPGSAATHGLT